MKKKKQLIALLACACLLTGCTAAPSELAVNAPTMPPAVSRWQAPTDDSSLVRLITAALCLPAADDTRLLTVWEPLTITGEMSEAETVTRALLRHPGGGAVRSLSRDASIYLSGAHPVTVSGGVCTVNLASSALQLSKERLHTVCLSIAATLCGLQDITHVDVLIAGQAVSMDVAGYLPLGLLTGHEGEQLSVLWAQMSARRTPLGESPSLVPVTVTVPLVFPLLGGGVMPEVRTIHADGQTPSQLAMAALEALSTGAVDLRQAVMPDVIRMLSQVPVSDDLPEGGRRITLCFDDKLQDALIASGIDRDSFFAAITLTLTDFVPQVTAVRFEVGGEMLQSMGGMALTDGTLHRAEALQELKTFFTILLPNEEGTLTAVTRTAPERTGVTLRRVLLALAAGPTTGERAAGLYSLMPGWMKDADILGISREGDTLVVNFSSAVAQGIRGSLQEQLLCGSLVNTLLQASGLKRCAFLFAGQSVQKLAGTLWWGGSFMEALYLNKPETP